MKLTTDQKVVGSIFSELINSLTHKF